MVYYVLTIHCVNPSVFRAWIRICMCVMNVLCNHKHVVYGLIVGYVGLFYDLSISCLIPKFAYVFKPTVYREFKWA